VLGTAAAIFVVVSVLPVGYMLVSLFIGDRPALDALRLDARQRDLLVTTTAVATGTAVLATLIGAPLGIVLARVPMPYTALVRIALAAPFALPPYVVGLAWMYLVGTRDDLTGVAATAVVLSLVFYPLPMLATEIAVRGVDGRLEEAGLLVAAPGRVLRAITLPLAAPVIVAAALVVFVLAASDFGLAGLMQVRVYTTEVFTAFSALYDFERATLLMLPPLLLSMAVTGVAGGLMGDRLIASRRGARAPVMTLPRWRTAAGGAVAAAIAVAVVVPIGVLLHEAIGVRSVTDLLAASWGAMVNSLWLSAVVATAAVGLGFWIGYWRARTSPAAARLADTALVALFAVPSTVIGVGMIGLWNRPGIAGVVYGTSAMIVLASLARLVPVASLALAARISLVPTSHEEAAAVSGAGWLRTTTRIVAPQIAGAMAAAWVVGFVLAFGELGATILVAPPGDATLPIHVYTMIANAPSSHVAALALVQTGVVVAPLVLLGAVAAAWERR
jgi:iron(III) transport system permease protein